MPHPRDNRIFFLGMHVVLTRTELPRLRALGYEVFNPPYLSSIYDQSANREWDAGQPTTLPREVFEKLSRTNFFYEPIAPDVAELLNEHFGTVFVTINPDWLWEVAKVFRGRVVYRTYGQPWTLSEALLDRGMARFVQERGDQFHILPFAEECCQDEHDFFRERMKFVPYCLGEEVFEFRDTWAPEYDGGVWTGTTRWGEGGGVMVPVPNVRNAYYRNQYDHINAHFPGDHLRIYGVQPEKIDDPRVVGTLPRREQLQHYRRLAGQFYPYHDENVCYLPPIEMMTVGGPVVYVQNSLLHKYFGPRGSPGLASSIEEARRKIDWVRRGDKAFVDEVIAAQGPVRQRYAPEHVWPIFDRTIRTCIPSPHLAPASAGDRPVEAPRPTLILDLNEGERAEATPPPPSGEPKRRRAYILFHFRGGLVHFRKGEYYCTEGIPRVMLKFVRALVERTELEVVVTCEARFAMQAHGFFAAGKSDGRVKVLVIDPESMEGPRVAWYRRAFRAVKAWAKGVRAGAHARGQAARGWSQARTAAVRWPVYAALQAVSLAERAVWGAGKALFGAVKAATWGERGLVTRGKRWAKRRLDALAERGKGWPLPWFLRRHKLREFVHARRARRRLGRLVSVINADDAAAFVLDPHYYLFPEATKLRHPVVLFLFDYIPHFFPGITFEPGRDAKNVATGREVVRAAHTILTGSKFSASYLPQTVLGAAADKIAVVPIPLLAARRKEVSAAEREAIDAKVAGKTFLFYPTANRPNKQIPFLLEVFAEVLKARPDVHLVLTCTLSDYAPTLPALERAEAELGRARARAEREAEITGGYALESRIGAPAAGAASMVAAAAAGTALAPAPRGQALPKVTDRLLFCPGVSDAGLQYLYTKAAALAFTSTMEGNFPPQIFEAVSFGCPVVATRIPLITEVLGDDSDDLLFCPALDKAAFTAALLHALDHGDEVRARQGRALSIMTAHAGDERFSQLLTDTLKARGLT